ncbi:uncharacterized protein LOC123526153 [Mercenaria mercenaria]|uniref:uncharacterized protein LOC123526153 n=1 Tax=Mercenaria mercenaria TaxID=6596 RepID=UPI00234F5E86|nr:uncharacterized protein LOC123526153 [Mercenaria mercenaria]
MIHNHKIFSALFGVRSCIEEARDVGRKIRHTPDYCISDKTLHDSIDKLCKFLESCRSPNYCSKTKEASQNLNKLKNEELAITTNDVTKILQEVIKERTARSLQELDSKSAEVLQQILDYMGRCQDKTSKHLDDIFAAKEAALASIEDCKASAIDDIKTAKRYAVADIKKVSESCIKEIPEKSSNAVSVLTDADYQALKQNLREDLITYYEDEYSNIPLTPMIPENEVDLLEFFVPPELMILESTTELRQRSAPKNLVTSFSEIFMYGEKMCRNIFITAEAGQGKTTFSKRLCLLWCHATCSRSIDEKKVSEEEIKLMKLFDFVFLIPLRFVHGNECDIDDMIFSQVLNQLSRSHKYTHTFLKDLLHQERSLVILEGLDEWSHPKDTCCTNITPIPHRKARQNCTVLSTSRPWKIHEAKISKGKDKKHLEMLPLNEDLVETLIHNVTAMLLTDIEESVSDESVYEQITSKHLEEVASTPVVLVQLVCLLHDGKLVGNSRCDIYCSITDFMLSQCEEKLQRGKRSCLLTAQQCCPNKLPEIPESMQTHDYCKKYYMLLSAVGKLAYTTLFKYRKDSAFVFGSAVADEILSQDQLECCLEVGLLTKNKAVNSLSSRQITFSFIHQTFQEFFAAFYLQTLPISSCVTDVLNVCSSIDVILEMSGVFIFLCNLCPESCNELFRKIPDIVGSSDLTRDFRCKILRYSESDSYSVLQEIQDMYVECIINNKSVRPHLQDLIVDENCSDEKYEDALTKIAKISEGRLKSLVLDNEGEDGNLREVFRIFDLHQVHYLEQLDLFGDINGQDVDHILARSNETLKCLSLGSCTLIEGIWHDKMVPLTVESIHTLTSMSQLEALDLTCFTLPHAHLEVLVSFITELKSLRQLFLAMVKCNDHGNDCCGFDLDISQNKKINILGLGFLPLSRIMYDTTCLEKCYIGDFQSTDVFSELLASLPQANNLQEIEFDEITCPNNLDRMFDTIGSLHKLKLLMLTSINFGTTSLELSADMVDLEEVCMTEVKLSPSAYKELLFQAISFKNQLPKYNCVDCVMIDNETGKETVLPDEIFSLHGDNDRVKMYISDTKLSQNLFDENPEMT